jgi:hypothetical protein
MQRDCDVALVGEKTFETLVIEVQVNNSCLDWKIMAKFVLENLRMSSALNFPTEWFHFRAVSKTVANFPVSRKPVFIDQWANIGFN